MMVAIMQPYFFPYIGYFQLINAVDRFILGDGVQYIKEGWINRNRVLKSGTDGNQYIIVPLVKHHHNVLINCIKAIDTPLWKEKILRQLEHYKKAPYFNRVFTLLCECFESTETNIARL